MVTLTSPGIDKPEPSSDKYDDVHVVGSRYGQDLDKASIERMLKGEVKNPFQELIDFLSPLGEGLAHVVMAIPTLLIGGLAWALGELAKAFQGGSNPVPYPQSPVFQDIPDKLLEAVAPLREVLEANQQIAEDATEDAKKINTVMETAFANGEDYSGDLQLQWNKLVNNVDEAQNASINSLKLENISQEDAILALTMASMRSGRIVVADREQAVNDGYVRVDNPRMSSASYVTARDGVSKWYGNITVITQWRGGESMLRSGWVEAGKLVGKEYIYLDKTLGHIEHTIAIYSEMPKEEYLAYKAQTTVTNH